jgi:hypothetical protein
MRFPGRLYRSDNDTFLAVYNFFPDVYTEIPPSLRGKAERVAHASYSEGKKARGIDVFRLTGDPQEIPEIGLHNEIRDTREGSEHVDMQQGVMYEIVEGAKKEVLDFLRTDISTFCKKPAADQTHSQITWVDRITPRTELKRIEYSKKGILTPGKQEFVRSCALEANIDFGKGCISGWIPGDHASFKGDTFYDYYLDPFGECEYCYAAPKHKTWPKSIFNLDAQRLEEELRGGAHLTYGSDEPCGSPVRVLRFGKRTEAASPFTLDPLALTLETCLKTGTRTVLPTKFLEFDQDMAELLRKTGSQLLFSIGWDEFEPGPCAYGCDNDFRLEQARRFREVGVDSNLYLMIHAHASPGERETAILEMSKENGIPIQLLPERFNSKDLCIRATGVAWDLLKVQPNIPLKRSKDIIPQQKEVFDGFKKPEEMGTYGVQAGVLVPEDIHQDWLDIIGDNTGLVRMCHHNTEFTWCGSCFLSKGFKIPTEHVERTPIEKGFRTGPKPKHPLFDNGEKEKDGKKDKKS